VSATAVRTALVSALTADSGLMSVLATSGAFGGIYDEVVPEGAPFPCLVIGGKERGEGSGAFGSEGRDGLENIRAHDRASSTERTGSDVITAIYEHVERIIHGAEWDLGDWVIWRAKVRLVTTFVDPDGVTVTAPMQFTYSTLRK
jgi:hypothetical protein